LEKHEYSPVVAQKNYEELRSESRKGIAISETEIETLDEFLSPLLINGQSIHHICSNNRSEIMYSEKTIYNYVDLGLFRARNIDMPRIVKYRIRKSNHDTLKVDKECRQGRTYDLYTAYIEKNPNALVVQIDSVEGKKGGKVLLTIHFPKAEFMLAYIRERNTAASVENIFERLYWEIGPEAFMMLFPVLLADNGSEFTDPESIEKDKNGNPRTKVFYCDPRSPEQRPEQENNHSMIRRVIPKGTSLDQYEQADIDKMMNHINSYGRQNLGNRSPYEIFEMMYGGKILEKLGAKLIPANEIILRPALLKK